MSREHISLLNKEVFKASGAIRPWVVSLTDAFNRPDFLLGSPLALSDASGPDPWESYVDMVTSYTHRAHSGSGPRGSNITPYWKEVVAPMLQGKPYTSKL